MTMIVVGALEIIQLKRQVKTSNRMLNLMLNLWKKTSKIVIISVRKLEVGSTVLLDYVNESLLKERDSL